MEGFDAMTMHSYLAGSVTANSILPLDPLDHHSNYDAETFAGSEDASQYGQRQIQPQFPTPIKPYHNGFDDGVSDVMSNLDSTVPGEAHNVDSPNIERDHKLLSFSTPTLPYPLSDFAYRRTTISLQAQLHGMFFLAESAFPPPGDSTLPQTELTCYRRNLFQVTGNLTMPRGLRYIITEQGEQIPIIGQELTISATETVEGNPVKIICVPWKTPVTSAPTTDDKSEKEPTSIPIDLANGGSDMDSEFISFPIAWKRLQFRIATANNGRRKELQQHFVVRLKVTATLANGQQVSLCEVRSGSIVVRGRSPRNFQSKRDMPISGSGSFSRRRDQLTRTSTGDSTTIPPKTDIPPTTTHLELPQVPFAFDSSELAISPDFFDWKIPSGHIGAMTAMPSDFAMPNPGHVNAYAQSTPDMNRPINSTRRHTRAPINLSLVDDDTRVGIHSLPTPNTINNRRKTSSASPVATPMKRPRTSKISRPPSFSLATMAAVDESADILYEYFPLGLDDWMPPVDAVYRPHVVHHTNLPADPKAIKNRSKRYFSEDQPAY